MFSPTDFLKNFGKHVEQFCLCSIKQQMSGLQDFTNKEISCAVCGENNVYIRKSMEF